MIDLHTHSTFSDGTNSPEKLVDLAVKAGLTAIALTDHDTMAGIPRFIKACQKYNIRGIPGIEFSVDDELAGGGQVHMIGLFVDHERDEIKNHAYELKEKRLERNRKMLLKLEKLGITIAEEDILQLTSDGVVGRAHIARIMVQQGNVSSVQEAFDKYLGPGRPAFVPKPRFTPEYIIELIHVTGGLAILAHPMYLKTTDRDELRTIILKMKNMGLDGVETFYPSTPLKTAKFLVELCEDNGLLQSGGSDFHGKEVRPEIALGTGRGDLYIPDLLLQHMEERLTASK